MAYSILLVEDEGAASRYLRSIIELKCPEFRVVAVAEDGNAGLAAARTHRPDLVITDIRMPGMDGLEFARRLKEELPGVPAVIVSGYQEFEYARRALGTGVVEYLLKPVSARSLADALKSLRPRLEANALRDKLAALEVLVGGGCAAEGACAGERYWAALFREGGLPSRFRAEGGAGGESGGILMGGEGTEADFFVLSGRDVRERLFLSPREKIDLDTFSERVRRSVGFTDEGFRTLAFAPRDVAEEELAEGVLELRRALDHAIIPGEARLVYGSAPAARVSDWDAVLGDRIEFCLANSRFDDLESAIRGAVDEWKRERRPLIHTEAALRKLFLFIQRRAAPGAEDADVEIEYFLDAALAAPSNWDELADAAWELVRRAAGIGTESVGAGDAPAFFGLILRYVDERYGRALSLGFVAETFRISETYLSKLFRKHGGRSFNEYLTFRRIEAAKRLMAESPTMPLKDVAACVGFQDPFYFSRVFKSVTGVPPSEFR